MANTTATRAREEAIRFTIELGLALQRYGASAHRLEDAMLGVCARLGLVGQFFTTPTAIFSSFEQAGVQQTNLHRVESGEVDLGKLTRLDQLADSVVDGRISPRRGREIIQQVVRRRRRQDRLLTVVGFGLVSGPAARFFGGGLEEIAVASVIGVLTGLLATSLGRTAVGNRTFELLSAFIGASVAQQMARHFGVVPDIAMLAGLIVLVPGLTLTTALSELATRNLVSGSARSTAAVIVFLQVLFGVALGLRLDRVLFGPLPDGLTAAALPAWTEFAAIVLAGIGLGLLFRSPKSLALWVIGASVLGFGGARVGALLLGPELGVALGAFVIGVSGNLFARWRHRPAVVLIVPGIIMLVPGSIGFRSLDRLLQNDPVAGVGLAFTTLLVGISIVAGVMMANLAVSPRRAL